MTVGVGAAVVVVVVMGGVPAQVYFDLLDLCLSREIDDGGQFKHSINFRESDRDELTPNSGWHPLPQYASVDPHQP